MTTPYCSVDQWAERKGYSQFASNGSTGYLDSHDFPNATELGAALEDATDIMNDTEHLNTTTNISDTNYTQRLERICYNMSNRMLDLEQNRAMEGGGFRWSPQDFLFFQERSFLLHLATIKSRRKVGGIIF